MDANTLRRTFYHLASEWVAALQKLQHVDEVPLRILTNELAGSTPSSAVPSPTTTASPTILDVAKVEAEAIVEALLEAPLPLSLPPPTTWKSTLGSILLRSTANSPRHSNHPLELPELVTAGAPILPPGAHGRVIGVYEDLRFSFAAYALNSVEYETELAALKLHDLNNVSTEQLLRSKTDTSLKLKFAYTPDMEFTCVVHYAIQVHSVPCEV